MAGSDTQKKSVMKQSSYNYASGDIAALYFDDEL
jgi:hypothetical protein